MRSTRITLALIATLAACGTSDQPSAKGAEPAAATDSTAARAHEAYTAAINSNNLDSLLGMLTEDVVFMPPNEKPYRGKPALKPWLAGYLAAYTTHWDKTVTEFVVTGEWAFEQYDYKSTDTPKGGGAPVTGSGWGLLIYHHDADGTWRVARDAWGSDQPAK